jgi:CubicO group peptidase (beta-lactamase class C family)
MPGFAGAHGGLVSTADDYLAFANMQLDKGRTEQEHGSLDRAQSLQEQQEGPSNSLHRELPDQKAEAACRRR